MQRRFLAPLPPGVTAAGTRAEPGEFPRTEQPASGGVPAPAALESAPVLCLPRSSIMGMTGCLLTCGELMEFTIHYRYIALEKKKNTYI